MPRTILDTMFKGDQEALTNYMKQIAAKGGSVGKLTEDDRKAILKDKRPVAQIARDYEINPTTVYRLRRAANTK